MLRKNEKKTSNIFVPNKAKRYCLLVEKQNIVYLVMEFKQHPPCIMLSFNIANNFSNCCAILSKVKSVMH